MRILEIIDPETWSTELIDGIETHVGWSIKKDQINKTKHRQLSLADGVPLLKSDHTMTFSDNYQGEPRLILTGKGNGGRLLVVVVHGWIQGKKTQQFESYQCEMLMLVKEGNIWETNL